MKKDPVKVIPLEKLQLNEGQLDWLPRNPRTWTQTDIDRTKRSLDEDPDSERIQLSVRERRLVRSLNTQNSHA